MGSSKISTIDLEEPVVQALNTIDTVADQITTVDGNVNTINTNVGNLINKLDNSTYGLSAIKTAINSNATKIDTVDGIVDTINSNISTVNTNVSSIKTTVEANKSTLSTVSTNVSATKTAAERLTSTRAGYLDYLANSTYGLSAIKTAISKIPTSSTYAVSSIIQSLHNAEVTYDYPVIVMSAGNGKNMYLNGSQCYGAGPFLIKAGVVIKESGNNGVMIYKAEKI